MEVNAQQVLEILNRRAQTEPLIQEIMRSAMFEAAYLADQATPIQSSDEAFAEKMAVEAAEL